MRRSEFCYRLPPELIAQEPAGIRTGSRLLVLDGASGAVEDRRFGDLPALLRRGDRLVLNDTRVIPARLLGRKDSGGTVEILVERILDARRVLAHVRASKALKPGRSVLVGQGLRLVVVGRRDELYELVFEDPRPVADLLEAAGQVPLPPYITRAPRPEDVERYQTVYARHRGAVAAPTAGLHFDEAMLERLRHMGVGLSYVTLHVGSGTFQPVRAEEVEAHRMHAEYLEVSQRTVEEVAQARAGGGRVVAVGTTVVRALESAAREGALAPFRGQTDIFIYPGYRFRSVDALVTNFHLPESTLLMLVCAFAGKDPVLAAYRHAVAQRYRFFSYGDAMFVTRR